MAKYGTTFAADYAVPPGETPAETRESLRMARTDLAQRTGLSVPQIEALLTGNGVLTRAVAVR